VFILFDAYGTLVELDDFYGRLQRGFARHGVVLCDRTVRQAAHAEMRHYMGNVLRARDLPSWEHLRVECAQVLGDAVREQGSEHDLPQEALLEILADAIVFRLFPETREVLEALQARGVPMGVLSNWDYQLPLRFEELDLARYFHFVLSSSQAGLEKPGVELFYFGWEHVQKVLPDLAPHECLYVGDHYQKDVQGAQGAGMRPVWIVRDERDLPSGDTPHDENVTIIKSLRELLEMNW
jgi:putative hydrolase of the HAD superfamily